MTHNTSEDELREMRVLEQNLKEIIDYIIGEDVVLKKRPRTSEEAYHFLGNKVRRACRERAEKILKEVSNE